ncbi:MAG: DUF6456 domain-containing protein [Pseudomonadota bacterium]
MPDADALATCRRLVATGPTAGAGLRAEDAALYLAHTALGAPLRRLAARTGRHPSTILRAVRRVEQKRDDPLLDDLLTRLEVVARIPGASAPPAMESALPQTSSVRAHAAAPAPRAGGSAEDVRRLEREARRILRRLSEPRAFLALARGAEVACVFRKSEEALVTLARTPLEMARGFAARDWIGCVHAADSMARYEITAAGRAWLKRALAEDGEARRRAAEGATPGLAEAPSPFARQHQLDGERLVPERDGARRQRVNLGESPLGWLAKRKGSDGRAFLAPEELAAGERLREDFEIAQLGPRVTQDWRRFLTPGEPGGSGGGGRGPAEGPSAARDRLAKALEALGPGLNDVALRACCFLEGLEATERRMGWSARSGKVVLKIALGRLAEHYGYARARGDGRKADGAAA